MHVGDHSKIQAPGHEAVHVCHKCGWPFPNSHPSARHRRAHKKLCGTLEGYKLVVSNDSDDGNHSDEDHKTPSPILLKRSIKEKGSGGIGDRSNRSEAEVFTDAAAEFSDSSGFSPGVEECFVDATKSVTNTERVANYDSTSNQSVNDIAMIDITQPSSSPSDIYQVKNHEVPDYKTDQLKITLQCEDDTPTVQSMVNWVRGSTAEESFSVLSNDSSSPLCNSDPNKYEESAYDTVHESETKAGETVTESSSNVHDHVDYSRGDPEVKFDSVLEDIVIEIEHSITEMTEVASKLEKTKQQDALLADGVFQSEEESTEGLNPKMSTSGSYPDTGPVELSDASFDTAEINVGAAQATDSTSSNYIGEGGDGKEGNESVHVLSVPEDVSLGSCKRIEDKEANLKGPICEENSSGSKQLSEGSAVPILEDNLDDRGSKFSVKEVPFKGEVSLPQAMVSVDENSQSDVGVPAYAATVEMKNSPSHSYSKEETPCDTADENFMETSMDAEANEITNLVYMEEAGNENSEGVSEVDSSENIVKTHESPSNMYEFQVNPSMGYSVGNEDHCKNGKCDVSENRGSGRPVEENVSMNTKAVPEFGCNLQDPPVAAVDVREGSSDKVSEIGCTQMDTASDSSRVGTDVSHIQESKGDKIHGSNTVQVEYVDRVSMPNESHHGKEFETFQKASEYRIVEEGVDLTQISAAVEENGLRGIGGVTSTTHSDTLQAEQQDHNIATQHSAADDVSINLCSRTDSLEAHWDSVSVFSTQSDAQTVIDAESLPCTDSLAPAESTNLGKPKHRQCSDKSDICEPPSFSTLAEPGAVAGQKDDSSSDMQAQQNAQHSISASAQAGWFPSLTNVVNDSPGRKKNQEIIGKVTNWNSLTSLVSETKPKSSRLRESPIPVVAQKDGKEATKVNFSSLTNVVNGSPGRKKNEEVIGVVTNWSTLTGAKPNQSPQGQKRVKYQ